MRTDRLRCRLRVISLAAVFTAACAPRAQASFQTEFERFNRAESARVLDTLDREIDIRIEEERAEQEKIEAGGEVRKEDLGYELKESGGWSVRPNMRFQTTRYSNYFDRRNDAAGETILTYIPSVRAVKSFDAWRYSSDYELRFLEQKNYEHNNRFHHAWTQSIVREGARWSVGLSNDLRFMKFATEQEKDKLPVAKINRFAADISYSVSPKTRLSTYYSSDYISFNTVADKASGSYNNTFGARVAHRIRPRIDAFFDYSYRLSRPPKVDEFDDINAQNYFFGLQGFLSPKLAANAAIGVESKEFADSDDKLGLVIQGAVRYLYSPKLDFTLSFQRDTVPVSTETSGDPLNQLVELAFNYRLRPNIELFGAQSVRAIQDSSVTTVIDPEHPNITTTKAGESWFLVSRIGARYEHSRDLRIALLYDFERVLSELQTSERTNHTATLEVTKEF